MEISIRYARLAGDALVSELERASGQVPFRLGLSGGRTQLPEVVDYHVGVAHVTLARLSAGRCRPIDVWLARPKPARVRAWQHFFGCSVHFAAEVSTLVYREADTLIPFAGASERLKVILAESAAQRLRPLPGDDIVTQVRRALEQRLDGSDPSAGSIARALGLSERSLRRKLKAQGTHLRELAHEARRQRALSLVRDAQLSEIAHRCGFSDGAAFARAFRRWTGLAPVAAMRARRH